MTTAFSKMMGQQILSYIRDTVVDVSVKKRSFAEQSAAVGGLSLNATERAELCALDAAAEIIQMVVSAGEDAKARGKPTPEWVLRMAAQARLSLIEEETEAEA